jgi:hypothetical protein
MNPGLGHLGQQPEAGGDNASCTRLPAGGELAPLPLSLRGATGSDEELVA